MLKNIPHVTNINVIIYSIDKFLANFLIPLYSPEILEKKVSHINISKGIILNNISRATRMKPRFRSRFFNKN